MNFILPVSLNKTNAFECFISIKSQLKNLAGTLLIDASNVTEIDSAGIALMLELKKFKNVKLINLNSSILELADLYQLKFDK